MKLMADYPQLKQMAATLQQIAVNFRRHLIEVIQLRAEKFQTHLSLMEVVQLQAVESLELLLNLSVQQALDSS